MDPYQFEDSDDSFYHGEVRRSEGEAGSYQYDKVAMRKLN